MLENQINELVKKVIAAGNPYIKQATKYFIDRKPMYIYGGEAMTEDELNKAYEKTARHDIKNGYNERLVGYYDKWYRYTRADEGRAYDEGVKLATASQDCKADMYIIECMA